MNYLTLLSVLFPIVAGAVLFVWRPQDRKLRNRYTLSVVLVNSLLVLATAYCTWRFGSEATAFRVAAFSKHLVFAFGPDKAALVFGCIIGVL